MFSSISLRRSVGLRLAAAIELQNAPASDDSSALLKRMLEAVNTTARDLLDTGDDHEGQVHLIHTLLEKLQRLARMPGGTELAAMVERLKQRVLPGSDGAAPVAQACSCSAEPGTRRTGCLCDLALIRDFVIEKVRGLYASQIHVSRDSLPRPQCMTDCVASDCQHAYFGGVGESKFSVNATTRVDARKIVVKLELQPDSLDIAAAAQTLYLLAHETICHAYQSLDEAGRENSDDTCAWTDGWMDTLAWGLTEHWLVHDAAQLPAWLRDAPEDGKRWCRKFHDRRYVEPRCSPLRKSDLYERLQARKSFEVLSGIWGKALPFGEGLESHRVTTFSVMLNHAKVDNRTRRLLIAELNTALNRRRDRLEDVAGVCSEFVVDGDLRQLLDDLHVLNGLPSPAVTS